MGKSATRSKKSPRVTSRNSNSAPNFRSRGSEQRDSQNHFSIPMIFRLTIQIRLSNYPLSFTLIYACARSLLPVIYHLAQRDFNTNHLSVAMDTLCTPTYIYIHVIYHIHGQLGKVIKAKKRAKVFSPVPLSTCSSFFLLLSADPIFRVRREFFTPLRFLPISRRRRFSTLRGTSR